MTTQSLMTPQPNDHCPRRSHGLRAAAGSTPIGSIQPCLRPSPRLAKWQDYAKALRSTWPTVYGKQSCSLLRVKLVCGWRLRAGELQATLRRGKQIPLPRVA
jgi:hypothetical protein